MFKTNRYSRTYYSIIYRAQERTDTGSDGEKHHIIPRCMGGDNSKNNLVKLTYREHFVCHRLLVKMTDGDANGKMRFAIWRMSNRKDSGDKYKITARTYHVVRKLRLEIPISDETRAKMSAANKGRKFGPMSEDTKQKLRDRKVSETTRIKMSEKAKQRLRRKHTEETKEKMANSAKGRIMSTEECTMCKIRASTVNILRWHNENCFINKPRLCKREHDPVYSRRKLDGSFFCSLCYKISNNRRNEARKLKRSQTPPKIRKKEFCGRGHDQSIHRIFFSNGTSRCKPCQEDTRREWREKQKSIK